MKIELRLRGVENGVEGAAEHVERRLRFALGRFGHQVSGVTVRLSDENGPRGGVDKRCHLTVRGPRLGTVVIEERHFESLAAVDLAAGRAGRAVARVLERERERAAPLVPGLAPSR